jgi:hypothetical protein
MAQSPEYPDLKWVVPKSWTNANRTSVQLIVIHDTEGSSHGQSAEDGAAYDARRTDGTSAHYFVDNNSVVQCVRTEDQAHTARAQGNRRGIQYELCARASWSKAKWMDPAYGLPMLQRAAGQCARDARKWGIPVRRLTPPQVDAGVKGFCGHADITKAFPEDRGTHTDPGANFPWDEFINMVKTAMGETTNPGRTLTFMKLDVTVPVLKQGDRDDELEGYNLIVRMQRIVGAEDDGIWGPATTAKVADWCKMDDAKCRTLTEDIYRKVFGAAR